MTTPAAFATTDRMPSTVQSGTPRRNRAHVASVDHRLGDRWGCQPGTAKARRERAFADAITVLETCLAAGDTDHLHHYLNRIDAALVGQPVQRNDPILAADKADAEEDLLECAYRENPCKQTARAWFDGLGREGRTNEPAMAELRARWAL